MASDIAKHISRRIKAIRLKQGLTQEQAAKLCHIKYKYYQEHESSKPRDYRLSTLEKIAHGLSVDIQDFFEAE